MLRKNQKRLNNIKINIIEEEESERYLLTNNNRNNEENKKNNNINIVNKKKENSEKETNLSNDNESNIETIIDENLPKDKSLESLNINEETIIYFEAIEDIKKIEIRIICEEKENYENSQDVNKLLLKYQLSIGGSKIYYLFANKSMKFEESLNLLKARYPNLKDINISGAMNNGNHLLNEKNKSKKFEDLEINYEQNILLIIN